MPSFKFKYSFSFPLITTLVSLAFCFICLNQLDKNPKRMSSSPRTVSRLVRDLASRFHACRFPSVEDSGNIFRKRPRKMKRTVTFDYKGDTSGNKAIKEIPVGKKSIKNSSRSSNNREEGEQKLPEPCSDEEDYIVFSFREDGAIDMTSEGKTSSSEEFEYDNDADYEADDEDASYKEASCSNTLSPASRKLHYGGHDYHTYTEGSTNGDDVRKIGEQAPISHTNVGESESNEHRIEQRVGPFESCDSTISENSFAFPVLSAKWTGSPVHMPRSQDYEPRSVRLYCCRF